MLSCDHSSTTGADSTPRRLSIESENPKIVSAQAGLGGLAKGLLDALFAYRIVNSQSPASQILSVEQLNDLRAICSQR
jgi:hypothetical protein